MHVSYEYYTAKDDTKKDIVRIRHKQTGRDVFPHYYKEVVLVIDRSGLQTEARISAGYGGHGKSYILTRSKDNIYIIKMKEYPDGLEKTAQEDIKTYELDLRDLINIAKENIETYDPILKFTEEDPLLIPSLQINNSSVREQIEKKRRQPGEIKMTQDEIDKRIKKDCKNKKFRKAMKKMELLKEGR